MINKQNLWFISLFSLILVLSVYYLTLKDTNLESLTTMNNETSPQMEVTESSYLVALRVESDEELLSTMNELQTVLNDTKTTLEEKNDAYETLKELNLNKGKESELEKLIKSEYQLESFIKINGDKISVTIASLDHNSELANKIINTLQKKYDKQMYITVKFKK